MELAKGNIACRWIMRQLDTLVLDEVFFEAISVKLGWILWSRVSVGTYLDVTGLFWCSREIVSYGSSLCDNFVTFLGLVLVVLGR